MAGIGVWLEGATPDNIILPLILMGVEVTSNANVRDHYYILWSQDEAEVEFYINRLYRFMGWSTHTPMDAGALSMAMEGGQLLRAQYIRLWDMYYPTLHLERSGCSVRRSLREKLRDMPLRLPFVADRPWGDDYTNVHAMRQGQ